MAKAVGSNATVEASPDGSTWTHVGNVKKASLPLDIAAVDATDNDGSGWQQMLAGNASVKISFTCDYDPNDTGQANLISYISAKTICYLRYRNRGAGSGLPQCYGQAVITKGYPDSENNKTQEITFEASSTGSWTFGNQ